jgi:hypothetical protein
MKRTDKNYWATSIRMGSRKIYAWERLDRDGYVFVKFTSETKHGKDRRKKMKLPATLRVRDKKGRIDAKLVREAERAVQQFAGEIFFGDNTDRPTNETRPLTLAAGFRLALDLESGKGKYATKTERWKEVNRARKKLECVLGRDRPWAEVTPLDVQGIWRRMARAYLEAANREKSPGPRQTEVTIDGLYSVASWLRDQQLLRSDILLSPKTWRSRLKEDWAKIVGQQVEPQRPRHTHEDMRKLFAAARDPRVDPRLGLAFLLGGEQRLGQVLRTRRSQLDLPPVSEARVKLLESADLGIVRISGSGKKHAAPIALLPDQRQAIEAALRGYLAEYEACYTGGVIDDYYLFPARRLCRGVAKVVEPANPLGKDGARKHFRTLEAIAGVKSQKGRGWNGVRRIATDVAEDFEKDERVLNAMTGHRDSATRRLVYQERHRPEVLRKAALTRAAIRRETSPTDISVSAAHSA